MQPLRVTSCTELGPGRTQLRNNLDSVGGHLFCFWVADGLIGSSLIARG
jgi:hypothetical protein